MLLIWCDCDFVFDIIFNLDEYDEYNIKYIVAGRNLLLLLFSASANLDSRMFDTQK